MNPWFNDTNLKDGDFDNLYDSIDFIKAHEGFSPSVYTDAGNKKSNIGYGFQNTGLNSIDRVTADRMLNNYLKNQRSSYRNSVYTNKMTPWGRTVADDLLYRGGYGSLKDTEMLKALQMGDDDAVAQHLPSFKYATDPNTKEKVLIRGLMNRNDDLNKVRAGLNKIQPIHMTNDKGEFTGVTQSNPTDIFDILNKIEKQPSYMNPVTGVETPAFVNKLPVIDENYVNPNSWNTSDVMNIVKGFQPSIKMTPSVSSEFKPEEVAKMDSEDNSKELQDNVNKFITPQLPYESKEEVPDSKTDDDDSTETPLTEEEKLQKMMDDYKARRMLASETEGKNALISSMLNAGSTIGAAIAGVKPDREGIKALNLNKDLTKDVDSENNELYKLQSLVRDLALAKERAAAKKDLEKEKADLKKEDQMTKLRKTVSDIKGKAYEARAGIGGTASSLLRGKNLLNIISSYEKTGEMNDIQVQELANMTDTMLKQGGSAVRSAQKLVPYDIKSNYQKFADFMTSKPNKVKREEFLSTLKQLAENEVEGSTAQIRDYQVEKLGPVLNPQMLEDEILKMDLIADDLYEPLKAKYEGRPYSAFNRYLEAKRSAGHTPSTNISSGNRMVKIEGKVYSMTPEAIAAAKKDGHTIEEME